MNKKTHNFGFVLLFSVMALPLLSQRSPTVLFRDYGDSLRPAEEMLAQQKADEVTAQKGWAVKIVTHTTALPQIEQSLQGWTAQGSNTVVFYVLARQSGGIPIIAVTDDLESVLPLSVRQHIAQRIMLPWYMNADYSTCLREGMEALLSDQLVLESVAFEGSYPINGVEEPQWQLSASSDAEDGVLAGAVCYKRQDVMELRPTFSFTGALPGSSIKIKATSNDATYTVDGAVYNESTIQPSGPGIEISTGESVDYWADFEVEWSLSFDGGGSWVEVQKTENEVYITWGEPIVGSGEMSEELLFFGCNSSVGIGGNDNFQIINELWEPFSSRQLNITHFRPNVTPRSISYYATPFPEYTTESIVTENNSTIFNGECRAFVSLFRKSLLYQGINSEEVMLNAKKGHEYFLIKDWFFLEQSFAGEDYPYVYEIKVKEIEAYNIDGGVALPVFTTVNTMENEGDESTVVMTIPDIRRPGNSYEWIGDPEVKDNPNGIPGQNVQNPYSDFGTHFVVSIDGYIYDPSYGEYYVSLDEWEESSVASFFWYVEAENGRHYLYLRQNQPGNEME